MSNNIEILFLNKSNTILLSGELFYENVNVAHRKILSIFNSLECNSIKVCFKDLRYCDIVGIQLILSLLKTLASKSIKYNIVNLNKDIIELIKYHGFDDIYFNSQ